jgi:glycerol dehydrogenase
MAQIFIAPSKYVQGPNELKNLASYVSSLGKRALCLISESGLKRSKDILDASFQGSDVTQIYEKFNQECSKSEIERISKICMDHDIDVVIGIGGGKTHDTTKAVSFYRNLPVVIVPTIASTDAPCSALSVIYSDEGVFEEYLFLKQNPNLVLVDTTIVAQSPTRLLVAGMGDALATYFEARACGITHAVSCAGGTSSMAAQALAKLCYDTLLENGYKAKLAVDQNCTTKAVEKIIEANTLLSGIGFESAGLAGAHAIHNGLTVLSDCHSMYHGEKVAFGTIVQLVLENSDLEELQQVLEFCTAVGLPTTLEDLGVTDVTQEKIRSVAKAATVEGETIHNMPFPVTEEDVFAAIMTADALGHSFR